jgi:hypothetical protein
MAKPKKTNKENKDKYREEDEEQVKVKRASLKGDPVASLWEE